MPSVVEDDREDRLEVEVEDSVGLIADSPSPPPPPYEPMEDLPPLYFVERLASVPLVKAVFGAASQYYSGAKAHSALLAAALATAENAAAAVGRCCEATVRGRFGPQLERLDALSCQGLDLLEERYPVLLRQPKEIADDVTAFGRRKAAELGQYGLEKIDRVRDVLTTAAQKVAHPVDTLVSVRDALCHRTDQAFDRVNELLDSLSLEARFAQELGRALYALCLELTEEALSTSDPPETPREHAVTAARHALLALSLLTERPRRFYASLYASLVARFRSQPPVESPSSDSSPPSTPPPRPPSATANPSSSDDSFSTSSTT